MIVYGSFINLFSIFSEASPDLCPVTQEEPCFSFFPGIPKKNSTATVLFFSALTETAREIFYVLFIFFPCILYLFFAFLILIVYLPAALI